MKREDVEFLSVDEVIELQAGVLARFSPGDDSGVKDLNGLESAVMAPRNAYVDTLAELASVYAYGIGCAHYFHNGNKRAGAYAAFTFLEMNGFYVWGLISEHVMVDLVQKRIAREDLVVILVRAMGGDEAIEA